MINEIPIKNQLIEIHLAIRAVLEAGKTVMNVYNHEFSSTLKRDNEPLTEADVKITKLFKK